MNKRGFCAAEDDLGQALEQWFSSYPGSALLQQEQASLEPMLSQLFGYYLLQVGFPLFQIPPGLAGRVKSPLLVTQELPRCPTPGWVCGDPLQLPVAGDSVDAVLLQHALDFSTDPRQLLREAERVLIPEGHLVVVGFNPWSLWGVWRLFHRPGGRVPWCGHFLSQHRLHDWLSLLGFDLERTESLMFKPPLKQPALMERLQWVERLGVNGWSLLGGVYIIQAVKRVSTLTPLKSHWKLRQALLGSPGIEPTTRTPSR
jgi:SAM-dependent methyltransferase